MGVRSHAAGLINGLSEPGPELQIVSLLNQKDNEVLIWEFIE